MNLMPEMERWFEDNRGFNPKGTPEARAKFDFSLPDWYDARQVGPDIARSIVAYAPKAKPMKGSIQALRGWYARGNEILIVTAAAESTMETNKNWLNKWLARPYTIERVNSKDGKIDKLLELEVTHYVDDRFRTCCELAPHLEHVYLFDATCNRGREPEFENVTRIKSLRDMLHKL